ETVVAVHEHTPVRVRDLARVSLGPAQRRGALDDAGAEAVGGVVVVRHGANPLEVIEAVKAKIAEIAPGLPSRTLADGSVSQVVITPFYDRTVLIHETLDTLSTALIQQILITVIVVLVMLRNLRSSVLISSVLPIGVLGTFVAMKLTGVDANIMALAGIAIAIGTMVDVSIVLTENISRHLDEAIDAQPTPRRLDSKERAQLVKRAAAEVAPAILTSVATTVVSFLPVFALTASEGKLFSPLAFTKTFALLASVLVALLILPAVAHLMIQPKRAESEIDASRPMPLGMWWRSTLRGGDPRSLLIVAGGVLIASLGASWIGASLACVGALMLGAPLLSLRQRARVDAGVQVLAVLALTLYLSRDWMPLGVGAGPLPNFLFVGLLTFGVLGLFRVFLLVYPSLLRTFMAHRLAFLCAPLLILLFGMTAWLGFGRLFGWLPETVLRSAPAARLAEAMPGFGREYMPPFDEGSYLYMPTTMPHASIGEALEILQEMDAAIASIPEVERCVGKLGRAESALDPAPISMYETLITYLPEYRLDAEGRRVRQWRDHIRSPADIWDEIVAAAERPGLTSAPVLQPISTRLVMLQSGMRAPMGIKVRGPSLEAIEAFGLELERLLREVPGVRPETVFADRVVGKPYLEIEIDREAIGRYGLTIRQVQSVIQIGLGGRTLTRTVQGRERYPVRVRFMREERDSVEALEELQIPVPGSETVPLSQLASIRYARGPQVIKAEDTFLTSYVLFDREPGFAEVDVVLEAERRIDAKIESGELVVPDGVSLRFAGSYENQVRSEARLMVLVPIALLVILLILQLQFQSLRTTLVIYSGVAVAIAGGFILLWFYGRVGFLDFSLFGAEMRELFQVGTVNMSVAVWIGFIALLGVATDDGVVMATYLQQRFSAAPPTSVAEVRERTLEAGVRRVRPCLMTTATTLIALLPVVTSFGRGADVMMPMALPALGGMSVALITLFVVPVLHSFFEERALGRTNSRKERT
ncbi:MAG: efflux RND transporter permease subunit, partial [Myxococcales bacterium]|nr:efflux RND transporter permease subunit [Myxococcales bacterium]